MLEKQQRDWTKFAFFWQNNAKLVKKTVNLCEVGIVLAKQYEIGHPKYI
ncbi:hypothetical protein BN193_10420 [Lactococcus raffinolactis 4877]|nr:hypothetical protein BN193_10420 [Lactococcus raffinolactis 4877]